MIRLFFRYRAMGRPMRVVVGTFLLGFGGLIAVIAGQDAWRGWRASSWPTVQGVIADSRLVETGGRRPSAEARVEYAYIVAGRHFTSRRVDFGILGGRSRAEDLVARYPPGGRATVHYDPGDPALAVLDAGAPWQSVLLAAVGAGVAAWGVWGLVLACRPAQGLPPGPVAS
ncbi:MAG: DUF3592 domain-containing protein [Planctomycetales bacterium]|nr:DUF3592 domain-containing protein [Planctomycetales bacterium]